MRELSYLNKYLLKYKHYLLLGTVFIAISNLFALLPAWLVRESFEMVAHNIALYRMFEDLDIQGHMYRIFAYGLLLYGLLILCLALLRGLFMFLMRQTVIVMSRHIEYALKDELYAHLQTLPLRFYKRHHTGDVLARFSEDVGHVRMYLGPALMYGINLVTLFLMIIPFMLSVHVRLTLFALLPLPLLSLSIYFINNIINRKSAEIQARLSRLSTFVQEAFSGIRVIKSFVRESGFSARFRKESGVYREKSISLARVEALFFPFMILLIGFSTLFVVYIGGLEVIGGALSIGHIAEFIIYISQLTWPVASLGWASSLIQRAAASQKRINEILLEKTDMVSHEKRRTPIKGHIAFEHVSFQYPDATTRVLDDVSFALPVGHSLAIVGSIGAGKTTLSSLLCRLYDVSDGCIRVDGIDIRQYDISFLRSQIGYVPQDGFLFSDTIYENIAFGSPTADKAAVLQAAQEAGLSSNIKHFSKGFDTMVGERGITLSGGQKQRVSIARALLRNPCLLLLDDCLSAVDTETENLILHSIRKHMKIRTTLIISHRISSAKLADQILVLNKGRITEKGTHEELLAYKGYYRHLYDQQLHDREVTLGEVG